MYVAYAFGQAAADSLVGLLHRVNDWSLHSLTAQNRAILAGTGSADDLRLDLAQNVLAHLPSPDQLPPEFAQQLTVLLGLVGASLGRHHQEAAQAHRHHPERAFAGLAVGAGGVPFLGYFARIAARTGTGHGDRDSYASLVRWNLPQVDVRWAGQRIATLPSVFDDGRVRSYTAVADETRFFGLLKASEVLEKAVNQQLIPLSDGSVGLEDEEALRRIARAVLLLDVLRELNRHFAALAPEHGMGVGYFMDVFRQFAIHWRPGDIPPSGAQDVESLVRDLLLGIAMPGYSDHLHRLFPALLESERSTLETLLERPSLPLMALERAGLDAAALALLPEPELRALPARHPVLAALCLLLNAQARATGVHLMLSKRFLFSPQRVRDRTGLGDAGVVSNRSGTTGLTESRLEALARARHEHVLGPLRQIPAAELEAVGRPPRIERELPGASEITVRFTGSALPPEELGLPALTEARPSFRRGRS